MVPSRTILEKRVYPRFPQLIHPLLANVFREKKYLKEKLENILLNDREMRSGKSLLKSYPSYLVADPTNICNLKCPLCPTWQEGSARPKGRMEAGAFRRLLQEAGPFLFAVNLCNWGEPLLNPDLPVFIREAKQYNTVVGLSTNLNYLPDGAEKNLVDSGIDILVVSLDGASQESYAQYRRGGNLSTVLQNIERLNACRSKRRDPLLLIWQFLVNRFNEPEIGKARKMADELGMHFLPSPMRTSMGKELLLPLHERVREIRDWLPENPAYNKYAYEITPATKTRQDTCRWLWTSAVVNWDGSVSPCCGVYEKQWDFGTCCTGHGGQRPRSFRQAWNSPRYRMARMLVAAHRKKTTDPGVLLNHAEAEGIICSKCIRFGFLEE
ncbi:MAG: radical SAM protein [Nitrospirota bacterium]